jgi:hypothetical protein
MLAEARAESLPTSNWHLLDIAKISQFFGVHRESRIEAREISYQHRPSILEWARLMVRYLLVKVPHIRWSSGFRYA